MGLPSLAVCGVHVLNDDDTPGALVGGAPTNEDAIHIACAAYLARQEYEPSEYLRIGVFDSTGVLVAVVGLYRQ